MKLSFAILIGVLLMGASGASCAWETGTITGVVRDYADPNIKLSDVTVSTNTGVSATTNAEGVYTMNLEWGQYVLTASSDAIYPSTVADVEPILGGTKVVDFHVVRLATPVMAAADDFNRPDSADLGSTPIGGYVWAQTVPSAASIASNALYNSTSGDNNFIYPQGLTVRDFDLSISVKIEGGGDGTDAILYRQDALGNLTGIGYALFMRWSRGRTDDLYLRANNVTIATVDLGSEEENWSIFHTVRIRAIGNHHQVWWDGNLVIDVTNSAHPGPGFVELNNKVGLNASWWDDFSLQSIAPPMATVSGTVSDLVTPAIKIQGAEVTCSSGDKTVTDINGHYEMQVAAPIATNVTATAAGYVARTSASFSVLPGGLASADVAMVQYASGDVLMSDTFTRDDGPLGSTEVGGYSWMQTGTGAVIASGQMVNAQSSNYIWPDGFTPSDFDLSMDVRLPGGTSTNWIAVLYRKQVAHSYGAAGYAVHLRQGFSRTDDIFIRSGTTMIGQADLGATVDWNVMHQIRIRAIGSRHIIYWDGVKVIEVSNSSYSQGLFEIVSWLGTSVYIDNIEFRTLAIPTGSIGGSVTSGGSPVAGAVVRTTTGRQATTGLDGSYLIPNLAAGNIYSLSAMLEGYDVDSATAETLPDTTVTANFSLDPVEWLTPVQPSVADTFTRPDSWDLGMTEVGGKTWRQSQTEAPAAISFEQLSVPQGPNYIWPHNYRPADFDMQFSLLMTPNNYNWFGLVYRKPYINSYGAAGYHLYIRGDWLYSDTTDLALRYGTTQIATADLGSYNDWSVPITVRVRAVGARHQVWVNGAPVVDIYHSGRLEPGYFQFVSWYPETCIMDDLQSRTVAVVQSVSSIAEVKELPDGSAVRLSNTTVSAQLYSLSGEAVVPFAFYTESDDRSSGIRVVSDQAVTPGDRVTITGIVTVQDGECVLIANDVSFGLRGTVPLPLGSAQRGLGGGQKGLQPAIAGGEGLSNVGLLVRIAGKVTASVNDGTYEGSYFYVDDGSAIWDGSGNVGIRCRAAKSLSGSLPYVPAQGSYVAVTGALGATKIGGYVVRILQPSTEADIDSI